jgi:uncharacterized membrane protein YbhN (UPF0104 family)
MPVAASWEGGYRITRSETLQALRGTMLNATKAISRSIFDKIGEKIGWNKIGIAISLLIIAIAGITLYKLLQDIQVAKVVAALREKSMASILTAGAFIAVGYVTLTFYDYFSLRTIGRGDVPYRVAAFASFTSYSIGHNLGATVFTAGAVRYRIYSAWGISVLEVAKIAFVTGLTFWLGNAFVLGVSIAYAPEVAGSISQLPTAANRVIAMTGLTVILGYMIWLLPRPRTVGRNGWEITLPNARLTLVQIGIGVLDLGSCGLAMYALMPAAPSVDPVAVLVTFVIATLLGFLSHAPGSLGVLEAAMLVGLPQFEKEQLLASLLIYRFLYFIVPLFFAVLALGTRELWLATRNR